MPRASFTRTSSSISATDKVKLNFKIENNKLEIDVVDLITSFREAQQVANEMELRKDSNEFVSTWKIPCCGVDGCCRWTFCCNNLLQVPFMSSVLDILFSDVPDVQHLVDTISTTTTNSTLTFGVVFALPLVGIGDYEEIKKSFDSEPFNSFGLDFDTLFIQFNSSVVMGAMQSMNASVTGTILVIFVVNTDQLSRSWNLLGTST